DVTEHRRTQERLLYERFLLQELMDHIPDNIYFKDAASRFTRINRECARRFGLADPADAAGKTDFDIFGPEHAGQAFQDEQRIMRTGQPLIGAEERETWPDGRVTWVSTTKVPLRDTGGAIIGTFGISRDITARKYSEHELHKSRERFALAVEGSKDGVWDWDLETDEVYFSPRWKAMLGWGDNELANRFAEWESRIHPDDRDRALATLRDYLDGLLLDYELEHRLRHKDGTYRWILARGVAVCGAGGRPTRMAGS